MTLDRRQFARAASSGIALFAIPGWFAACARTKALAVEPPPDVPDARPLLVLHVSDDLERRWRLGEIFGLFLMHGRDAELAALATCDLACATTAELKDCGLDLAQVHALVLAPGAQPAVALEGEFPFEDIHADPEDELAFEWSKENLDKLMRANAEANYAWIAEQLGRALGPGSVAFEFGCRLERQRHGELGDGATPTLERALARPFLALERAERLPEQRAEWQRALAGVTRERWVRASPKGSSWANAGFCGRRYENLPSAARQVSRMCGMAQTPEYTRRFLYLFTADERAGIVDVR
jgi:hypothetical protein